MQERRRRVTSRWGRRQVTDGGPQISLGPTVATPPYTESEFYSVEARNISLEVRVKSPYLLPCV